MTTAINLGLVVIILLMTYIGWQRNLYECAILVGQVFFAPFVALGLSTPLTEMLEASFPAPTPYIRAAATFVMWVLVLVIVDKTARSGLKRRETEKMKFHETLSIPGRLGAGLASGFLIAGFLALTAVMIPQVEGRFVETDSRVVMGLPGKTTALYASLNGAGPEERKEFLKQMRAPAGKQWAGNDRAKLRQLADYYDAHLGLQIEVSPSPGGEQPEPPARQPRPRDEAVRQK
ncbi:MAG: hypothetical protein V5A84_03095 [Planctomycetota bacterium]